MKKKINQIIYRFVSISIEVHCNAKDSILTGWKRKDY